MNLRTTDEVQQELARLRQLEATAARALPIMVRIPPGTPVATRTILAVQIRVLAENMGVDAIYNHWSPPYLAFAVEACEWRFGSTKRPCDFWRRHRR